jgi:hypothetical protein
LIENIASKRGKKAKAALEWYGGPYDPPTHTGKDDQKLSTLAAQQHMDTPTSIAHAGRGDLLGPFSQARFFARAYDAPIDCLVIFPRASQSIQAIGSGDVRLSTFVDRPSSIDDHPGDASDLCRECHGNLVDMHTRLQRRDPRSQPISCPIETKPNPKEVISKGCRAVAESTVARKGSDRQFLIPTNLKNRLPPMAS